MLTLKQYDEVTTFFQSSILPLKDLDSRIVDLDTMLDTVLILASRTTPRDILPFSILFRPVDSYVKPPGVFWADPSQS